MSSLRWRFSFLVSLVSCVPVMGMMMYMIIMDYQMSAAHQHNVTAEERNHYHSTMLLEWQVAPGLSLMNLLSFIFCIPVQVNQSDCAAIDRKCDSTECTKVINICIYSTQILNYFLFSLAVG